MLRSSYEFREVVEKSIGKKYVGVIASAIERLARERNGGLDGVEASRLAIQARDFFDRYSDTIFVVGKLPIGSRREIMCDYLAGRDVTQFTDR